MSEYSLSTSISNSNASLNSSSTSATNSNASLTFSLLHQQLIRIVSSSQPIIPMKDTFYLTLGKERFPFAMDREMEFQILERAQESMREPIGNQIVISNVNDLITRFCNLLNRYTFQKCCVLLPILKFLYHLFRNVPPLLNKSSSQSNLVTASSLPYSHIYILLVSLVILTLDSSYIETIMSTFIDPLPPWFPNENSDSKMSLGSLLAFVILKLMQININYDRDPFVHANAVAILTNISRFWKHIHLLVAFKFVHWFDSISKRFSKLKELSEDAFFTSNASGLEHTYSNADLVIYTDILTLFLTVFHCALHISFVRFNPYLVCALLNKENVFDEVSEFDEFSDLVFPLIELLEYFKSGISIHSLTSEKLYQHVVYQSKTVGSNYPIQR
ncbi:hypothetical protein HMI54_008462, partial [Coelomomyces lativittatus]